MSASVDRGVMVVREIAPEHEVAHAVTLAPYVDELWIVEDLPFAGGISQVAALLQAAERVLVGHGVAPAPFRNPAALAMEWSTLARMYPGRVHGGIGHGVPEWMEQIGNKAGSRLTLLEETITAVRRLVAGERVTMDGRYVRLDGVELVYPPAEVPLVSAGVRGPKSLELAGRVADGTILAGGLHPDDVRRARELVDSAAVGGAHRLTVFTDFACGAGSSQGALPATEPHGWVAKGPTPEAVAAELQRIVDAGADSIVLVPIAGDARQQLEVAAAEIWPTLR
jgi:alkanesulfonate monooxygenase SsuD/methylene tetrahydromethanopterin reductase-like flavin-dependent oxidoreductase (luciferase family)